MRLHILSEVLNAKSAGYLMMKESNLMMGKTGELSVFDLAVLYIL